MSSSAGLRAGGQGCVLTVGGPEAGLHGLPPWPVCAGMFWMTDTAQGPPCGLLSSATAWDSTSWAAETAHRGLSGLRWPQVGGWRSACYVSRSGSPSWPADTWAPRPSQGVGTFSGVYPGEGTNQTTPCPPTSPTGNHLPGLHLHVRRTGQGSSMHICGTQTLLPAPWAQHMLWPVTRPGLAASSTCARWRDPHRGSLGTSPCKWVLCEDTFKGPRVRAPGGPAGTRCTCLPGGGSLVSDWPAELPGVICSGQKPDSRPGHSQLRPHSPKKSQKQWVRDLGARWVWLY